MSSFLKFRQVVPAPQREPRVMTRLGFYRELTLVSLAFGVVEVKHIQFN